VTMPSRIQRSRTAGWRMPVLARYVGRPTHCNPFIVGATTPGDWHEPFANIHVTDRAHAVQLLRDYLAWRRAQCEHTPGWHSPRGPRFPWEHTIRAVLYGRDLACWCPIDQPCHADVLLEIANPQEAANG
jgi:hypothetical protein